MKLFLMTLGMLALGFFTTQQQENIQMRPTPSPDAEVWMKHFQRMDGEELRSQGVPDQYHYLYSFPFPSEPDEEVIRRGLPFTKIALSRSRCLGLCPAYEVEFTKSGMATYNGIAHTRIAGKHHANISLRDFGRISWAIERLRLTDPQPKLRGAIHDTPVTTVSITMNNGESVKVTDHGFPSPIELLLVSTLIDRVSDTLDWK